MKKISVISVLLTCTYAANAQGYTVDHEVVRTCAVIFTLLACMFFVIGILKRILEFRLKNKIVDKGISDSLASSLLETEPKSNENLNIKWFALLAGTAIGLAIVNYTQPLGIHSLAIMCGSISISFLGYYFFQQKKSN